MRAASISSAFFFSNYDPQDAGWPLACSAVNGPPLGESVGRYKIGHTWHVNRITAFGLFAVTAMLVSYALEKRSGWFILVFAGSCVLGSAYGFMQGAWPFGIVEAIWSVVAAHRWWRSRGGVE